MPSAPPTVLSPFPVASTSDASSSSPRVLSSISLFPFSINYDGPAPISTYFHPSPVPSTSSSSNDADAAPPPPQHQEAAFRGRLVVSTSVPLPTGYKGLVYETTTPIPAKVVEVEKVKVEKKVVKKMKLDDATAEGERKKAVELGLRRSPRKAKKVVVQYSMDSDESEVEEEGAKEEQKEEESKMDEDEPSQVATVVEEEVTTTTTVTTETTTVEEAVIPPTETPAAPLPPLSAGSSLLVAPVTPPPAPVPELEDLPEAKEEEEDTKLARDVKHLIPVALFDRIELWNADFKADLQEDLYARTIGEWVGVAEKVRLGCWSRVAQLLTMDLTADSRLLKERLSATVVARPKDGGRGAYSTGLASYDLP